jgi:hypothetical protein
MHTRSRVWQTAVVLSAGLLAASPVASLAQKVGDPLPVFAGMVGSAAVIGSECDTNPDVEMAVWANGGATLFAAATPNGAPLAVVPIRTPFPNRDPCPGLFVPGAPPGTYSLLMTIGIVTSASAPPGAWVPLVVPPRCTGAPGVPTLQAGTGTGAAANVVTLSVAGGPGCAWDGIEIEAGSSPGAADIVRFVAPAPVMTFPGVPNGTYYFRARARNQYGVSGRSREVGLDVPNQCTISGPQGPLGLSVTKGAGNLVTISWSQTTHVGHTFNQIQIKAPNGDVVDTIVLPWHQQSVSAVVPSGSYRIGVGTGGPCGLSTPITGDLVFTVP